MSLISFITEAGEKLFSHPAQDAAPQAAATATAAAPQPDVAALNAKAGAAIKQFVESQGLKAANLDVRYDGASETVTVSGEAPDQATREKIVLCCGNVAHVTKVDDHLTTAQAAQPEASFHTVQKGDTLSKIAKEVYGDANAYPRIFEANKPMLSNPDKIYPGQVLRIPK